MREERRSRSAGTHKQYTCTKAAAAHLSRPDRPFPYLIVNRSRASRARSAARRGGLAADARATCAHLSPPPYHHKPDGTPKQNGQQRTCRECSRRRSAPREGRRARRRGPRICLLDT